jgi:hypothetical protein
MGTRLIMGLIVAVLIGGGLILAALVPGIGLILLLGIVVLVVLGGISIVAAGRGRGVPTHEADLLGPGGPDDPRT